MFTTYIAWDIGCSQIRYWQMAMPIKRHQVSVCPSFQLIDWDEGGWSNNVL
jgi:hypothetical protein